jgi:septum formation protein
VRVVLASASPRRRALLEGAGFDVEVVAADVDETPVSGEPPVVMVGRLARAKAAAVGPRPGVVVVAADTTVDLDGRSLGKPADLAEAAAMLRSLAGRSHLVHTGVAVLSSSGSSQVVVTTQVTFGPVDETAVAWYVATSEPYDKAGGYAVQGLAARFVAGIVGSLTNVIGLPVEETIGLVRTH